MNRISSSMVDKINKSLISKSTNIYDIIDKYPMNNSIIENHNKKIQCLYKIINNITNKIYVGRTINPIERLYSHIRNSSNKELKSDFIKYGLINFTFICYKASENYKIEEIKLIEEEFKINELYNCCHIIKRLEKKYRKR